MATKPPDYCFSARLAGHFSIGRIDCADGAAVTIPSAELGALFLDMPVDEEGREARREHLHATLHVWFERKSALQVAA